MIELYVARVDVVQGAVDAPDETVCVEVPRHWAGIPTNEVRRLRGGDVLAARDGVLLGVAHFYQGSPAQIEQTLARVLALPLVRAALAVLPGASVALLTHCEVTEINYQRRNSRA